MQRRTRRTTGDRPCSDQAIRLSRPCSYRAPTRRHTQGAMTPPPATSAGTTLASRGTSNVLSYRYATSRFEPQRIFHDQRSWSAELLAL